MENVERHVRWSYCWMCTWFALSLARHHTLPFWEEK